MEAMVLTRVALLGLVTGMRSLLGLALLAWLAPPVGWLSGWVARIALTLFAGGELVGDKLPQTPSRLKPVPLGFRLLIGGGIGAMLAGWPGTVVGVLAALVGAFGGNKVRGALGRATGGKDLYFALAEDALAIGLALVALLGLR